MPELPEVQTVVDDLNRLAIAGRQITDADVYWPKSISDLMPDAFCRKIAGRTIGRISRRGKYIVIQLLPRLTMLIHLRMSGRLNWEPVGVRRNRHEHVVLTIDGTHELRFQDTRKFGRFFLTPDPGSILGRLGPEPLEAEFTLEVLRGRLHAFRRQIKPLLLNQQFLAGMGNIYVDEALWVAGIHPKRISNTLSISEIQALHRAIPRVLRKGLKHMGTSLGSGAGNFYSVPGHRGRNVDELSVFRRTGQNCSRCGGIIRRILVGQRSSHICPVCQPLRRQDKAVS